MVEGGTALWESVVPPTHLAEAVWDDGSVVYNVADGSLTALSVAATEALRELRMASALSTADLAKQLLDSEAGPDELLQLEAILEQLELLGLVRNPSS